ncbi:MAG: hypothetical protein BWX83_01118 [Candidatus Cloacimonetes bacterium ADurb.Bin117]|nr:MAG: hypothetical protein BWX83_01118 [Candidatus Cloacimonetes bacterium ADurb.Bin117]
MQHSIELHHAHLGFEAPSEGEVEEAVVFFLAYKGFHDADAGKAHLQLAVDLADGLLVQLEIAVELVRGEIENHHHQRQRRYRKQGQLGADAEHHRQSEHDERKGINRPEDAGTHEPAYLGVIGKVVSKPRNHVPGAEFLEEAEVLAEDELEIEHAQHVFEADVHPTADSGVKAGHKLRRAQPQHDPDDAVHLRHGLRIFVRRSQDALQQVDQPAKHDRMGNGNRGAAQREKQHDEQEPFLGHPFVHDPANVLIHPRPLSLSTAVPPACGIPSSFASVVDACRGG